MNGEREIIRGGIFEGPTVLAGTDRIYVGCEFHYLGELVGYRVGFFNCWFNPDGPRVAITMEEYHAGKKVPAGPRFLGDDITFDSCAFGPNPNRAIPKMSAGAVFKFANRDQESGR